MRIHLTINERTLRRTFREQQSRSRRLTVFDKDLRGFGFKVAADGAKTFFVRTVRKLGTAEVSLGNRGRDHRRRGPREGHRRDRGRKDRP